MGDKKEIRFAIDATSEDNRRLVSALEKYRPHERNKLIIDVLISHFVYGGMASGEAGIRADIGSDKVVELETELQKLQNRVDKVEYFLFNSSGNYPADVTGVQSQQKPKTAQAVKQEEREITGTERVEDIRQPKEYMQQEFMISPRSRREDGNALHDSEPDMTDNDTGETQAAQYQDIPDEVMAMITALQDSQ